MYIHTAMHYIYKSIIKIGKVESSTLSTVSLFIYPCWKEGIIFWCISEGLMYFLTGKKAFTLIWYLVKGKNIKYEFCPL